jgi:ribonuclease R
MGKRDKTIQDPYAQRESQNYENPIASREYILEVLTQAGKPLDFTDILSLLDLTSEEQTEALRRRLIAMLRDGQLVKNRKGNYALIDKSDLVRGRVISHRNGHGFFEPETAGDRLFISPKQMRRAFHGDLVLVQINRSSDYYDQEVIIVEVLERATNHIVGRLIIENQMAFVIPEHRRINQEIFVPPDCLGGAKAGQIVSVTLIDSPNVRSRLMGEVTEILGEHLAPGMEISIALRTYDLPFEWPSDVLQEAKQLPDLPEEKDYAGRKDLRDLAFVTIDGEDARDFDDAVFCEVREKGGWHLKVAIADVSHYVKPDSALDKEAKNRGNSVYFPGEVIPMLPEKLSQGLCSLNPLVDRLCLVCDMVISEDGKMSRYQFYPAVIHSKARLTYTNVAAFLGNDPELQKTLAPLAPQLENLHALFEVLHASRVKRGAIEFETKESYFEFDENRKIKSIQARERNVAHRIIEECMLAANVATAQFLVKQKIPVLFRVHEGPTQRKLEQLHTFLSDFGLHLEGGTEPQPKDYAKLFSTISKRPDFDLLQLMLLRSMNMATYTTENKGHFGLAYKEYTHFTSPIRRYPDLLVHRAIYQAVMHKEEIFQYSWEMLNHLGEHCSMTERRADEATRDVVDWLKCEFMQDRVGEVFAATITGVTNFGMFVQLDTLFVEGLVHISSLEDDYYHHDASRQQLCGERTGKRYRLKGKVNVRLVRVDLDERQIDFELTGKNDE